MAASDMALRLKALTKKYGNKLAVDQVSLDIAPGELVGFLGPNGAGKSTTFYMIPRLVRPTSGAVEIYGRDTQTDFRAAMRQLGIMVESPPFYEHLSAAINLELSARMRGGVARDAMLSLLKQVGLFERRKDRVTTFSQGMKQRLGLARVFLGNPRLLLLDEPLNGLDPEATQEIMYILRNKTRSEGVAIFLSSHMLGEVEAYCDRVILIDQGQMIAAGRVKDILMQFQHVIRVVFRGHTPDPVWLTGQPGIKTAKAISDSSLEITLADRDAAWLNRFLIEHGHDVCGLEPRKQSLREYFFELIRSKAHDTSVITQ